MNAPHQPVFDIRLVSSTQPVDMTAVQEFMAATFEKIRHADLDAVEAGLQEKGRRIRTLVHPDVLPGLTEDQLLCLLRSVFSTRRGAREILTAAGPGALKAAIARLLHGFGSVDVRFQQFVETLNGCCGDVRSLRPRPAPGSQARRSAGDALAGNIFCDLGSELLHFTDPIQYWLWTRWLWDPGAGTGALPLVMMEECDLHGRTASETYVKVGAATAFIRATGEAAGFSNFGTGPYGIDVFLACVYTVYMYTTLRMRMTQEFTRIVPPLPELIRRLLGVWRMEI